MTRSLAAVSFAFCLSAIAAFSPGASASDVAAARLTEETRRLAIQVSLDYRNKLIRELKLSGPVRAIVACKYACPDILAAQSRRTGWKVSAVSLKPRNFGLGAPDAWEQKVLMDFNRRAVDGEDENALELAEIVKEPQASYFRYARSIVVEPVCLQCHGARDNLKDAVKAQLAIDYPFDKAVDFSPGKVYGIISIKRNL